MSKRKAIPKKTRFEVFKRDSFTCQYCGKKAPDVILHIDHIKPIAKGGTNEIVNLITSCQECNSGKGKRLLTDNQTIEKMRKQAEELQERREQLELMMEWVEGLKKTDDVAIDSLNRIWGDGINYTFNENGRQTIRKHLQKYGYPLVAEAIEAAKAQYIKFDAEGAATRETVEHAFNKIGAICYYKHQMHSDPVFAEIFRLNGVLGRRISYHNFSYGLNLLKKAQAHGATLESLNKLVMSVRNWSEFRAEIESFCEEGDE